MFILNGDQITSFNLQHATVFIDFWSQFYEYKVTILNSKKEINYFEELNLGDQLTPENLKRLLRWKDPKFLTRKIMSGPKKGHSNPRVDRVVDRLLEINKFRAGKLTEQQFMNITPPLFPNGVIWAIFLFHIAKPTLYPIADQHVFRSMFVHTGNPDNQDWKTYRRYKKYFRSISKACKIPVNDQHLHELKKIDNALMSFGQFLKKYNS